MQRSKMRKKNTVKLSVFIALLGSEVVKAACKILGKLTPSRHFMSGNLSICKDLTLQKLPLENEY